MDENFSVQDSDIMDTTPEISDEENENVFEDEEETVTPDGDNLDFKNVERDTGKTVSERASEPFVSVQYNHKNRDFTKEEAVKLIQKGMHTEALRAKLEYLAKQQGTDVNSVVDRIVKAPEDLYRRHLEELYGKNSTDVEIGMAIYREKQSDDYKRLMADGEKIAQEQAKTKSINESLANQYMMLKKEMPDAPEYCDLPESVIVEAAEGKRDLFSAYLCYLHKEKTKIDAAKKTQMAASDASSGKMSKNENDAMSSSDANFLRGLWSR